MQNVGTSGSFWVYATIIALGLALLVAGMIYYFANKNKKQD